MKRRPIHLDSHNVFGHSRRKPVAICSSNDFQDWKWPWLGKSWCWPPEFTIISKSNSFNHVHARKKIAWKCHYWVTCLDKCKYVETKNFYELRVIIESEIKIETSLHFHPFLSTFYNILQEFLCEEGQHQIPFCISWSCKIE